MILRLIIVLYLITLAHSASAHDGYSNWTNRGGQGCCNNNDCDRIADEDVRELRDHVEVKIRDQWCEVKPHHYLRTGNAPDWSSAHVCIQKGNYLYNAPPRYGQGASLCHTLLCFQPKPQF